MKKISVILVDLIIIYSSILLLFFLLEEGHYLKHFERNINAFYIIAPVIGVLYLILMYAFGLYNSSRRSQGDLVYTVSLISLSLMMGIMATCFFVREEAMTFPRSVIFLSALCYWLLLAVWRLLVWKMERKHHGIKNVIVIGPKADMLASVIENKYRDIYNVEHTINEDNITVPGIITRERLVFLSDGVTSKGREKILLLAAEAGAEVFFIPEYRDVSIMSSSLQKTDDIPTFCIDVMGLSFEERFVKRTVDLILGGIGFVLALPFGLIAAAIVKLDGGPVFYCQERLTRDGKVFRVYKFRSMLPNAEKLSGPVLAGDNDPRITRAGKFLRAIRMDELPQILNILKGDMSIVGPRPERPFFTRQFEAEIPQYSQRLKVKAGLTGLAQVEGKYNTSFEDKLRYDLLYISNYSLFRDFVIILQTIKILFVKESTEGVQKESTKKAQVDELLTIGNYTSKNIAK